MFRTVLALSLALLSCGPNLAASEDGELEVSEGNDALATELKANVPSLTVWVKPALVPEVRDGRQVYVLRGRTSQNLQGINAYVFDDAFGSANVLSARTFEVVFDAQSELNSLAAGIRRARACSRRRLRSRSHRRSPARPVPRDSRCAPTCSRASTRSRRTTRKRAERGTRSRAACSP